MKKANNSFDIFFKDRYSVSNCQYSKATIEYLIRAILEPIVDKNVKSLLFTKLNDIKNNDSLIKRIEHCELIKHIKFDDAEVQKQNTLDSFVILTTERYNCVLLFKKVGEDKYSIFLKFNTNIVYKAYEVLKNIFSLDYDKDFYSYKPERRENELMNLAIANLLHSINEVVEEDAYNLKFQENYRSANEESSSIRNEIFENIRAISHEIKNQLSILDIYAKVIEKKTQNEEMVKPIRSSIEKIKVQLEQLKTTDVVNLQKKDVKQIIQQSINIYSDLLKEKNNKITLIDETSQIYTKAFIDEEKFAIVVNNIIKNAHESTQNDEIIIKLAKENSNIRLSFINHGEMIEQENQNKIFNSGFTTKKDGWGVGLSVCKKYIGSQFGTLELTKSDKQETIFTIILPLA